MALRVLVVEDDREIRDALVDAIEDDGYEALAAGNGEEALRKLAAAAGPPPCVILLDLMMPVMDGWEFRRRQRAQPGLADIPVVLLSAHRESDEPHARAELDALTYLRKPPDMTELLRVIRQACGPADGPAGGHPRGRA